MEARAISRSLEDFLAQSPAAVVIEGGEVIFDFAAAKYACSAERGKCLLHLSSDERNTVRRVLDAEMKNGALRLKVQRFGQARPGVMRSAVTATGGRPRPAKLHALPTGGCWSACSSATSRTLLWGG